MKNDRNLDKDYQNIQKIGIMMSGIHPHQQLSMAVQLTIFTTIAILPKTAKIEQATLI